MTDSKVLCGVPVYFSQVRVLPPSVNLVGEKKNKNLRNCISTSLNNNDFFFAQLKHGAVIHLIKTTKNFKCFNQLTTHSTSFHQEKVSIS